MLLLLVVSLAVALQRGQAADPAKQGEVTIHRDEFGVPHIFGDAESSMAFGMGYAQAEDRLEELLRQYRRCTGTMCEAFGPTYFRDDYRQRLWRHAEVAKANYDKLAPLPRTIIEAYHDGVRQFMKENPDKVPGWAPRLEPWMCVALSRYIIWGWPEGDAGGDMQRAGIKPDPVEYRGSNQWLVAPSRSAEKAVIALIDPHLSWYDQFRFYEARLYGGAIEFSGMAILGLPMPSLGHSRYCSVAMTTGGPDAADCYEEQVHPENPKQYRYDGAWKDMVTRKEIIRVLDKGAVKEQTVEIDETIHGPVVARKGDKAYTLKIPYADQFQLLDQGIKMALAKNLAEMKEALSMLQLMEQNVMVGTVDGDIYYLRNARVPIRPKGLDTKRPIPGDTSRNEWQGIHPISDLIQIENPPQGYMQNCNVSPQYLMKNCPIQAEKYAERPYLFNGFYSIAKRYDNPLHQRAAMCLELLDSKSTMTIEDAFQVANSPDVYQADVWQQKLRSAFEKSEKKAELAPFVEVILAWNRRCDPDSKGAVAYRYWKEELPEVVRLYDRAGLPPNPAATDAVLLAAAEKGAANMKADHGRYDVAFGEVYRVGRRGSGRDWPVGGGSVPTLETPRAIGFDPIPGTKKFLGKSGQTSTQVVLLTKPPRSWTYVPLGQSDDPKSPHYDDQAERLFSPSVMKPTYFLDKEALLKNVRSTKTLQRSSPSS